MSSPGDYQNGFYDQSQMECDVCSCCCCCPCQCESDSFRTQRELERQYQQQRQRESIPGLDQQSEYRRNNLIVVNNYQIPANTARQGVARNPYRTSVTFTSLTAISLGLTSRLTTTTIGSITNGSLLIPANANRYRLIIGLVGLPTATITVVSWTPPSGTSCSFWIQLTQIGLNSTNPIVLTREDWGDAITGASTVTSSNTGLTVVVYSVAYDQIDTPILIRAHPTGANPLVSGPTGILAMLTPQQSVTFNQQNDRAICQGDLCVVNTDLTNAQAISITETIQVPGSPPSSSL